MKHAIAGVAPPELGEVTIMTVWPSIAASPAGRMIGRLCGISWPTNAWPYNIFNLGKMFALAMIPVALTLYLIRYAVPLITQLMTFGLASVKSPCLRYRLTNQRLIVEKGLFPEHDCSVALDHFDRIDVEVLPGQEWFPAGELIFRQGAVEVFQLSGVRRPEGFRQVCLKAHQAYVTVQAATGPQAKAS